MSYQFFSLLEKATFNRAVSIFALCLAGLYVPHCGGVCDGCGTQCEPCVLYVQHALCMQVTHTHTHTHTHTPPHHRHTQKITHTYTITPLHPPSILYKAKLPFVVALNKIDIVDAAFALDWMNDFESFQEALEQVRDMSRALQ